MEISQPYLLTALGRREPLLDTATLRAVEQAASAGLAPGTLMERAGLAAARLAMARWPGLGSVRIYCGPGNNGGDGLVMARHLHQLGIRVDLRQTASGRASDRQRAEARALQAGLTLRCNWDDRMPVDLTVDALLGIGSSTAPHGAVATAMSALAQETAPRMALDVPSGLDADLGRDWGALRCDVTLALLAVKPGLVTGAGRELCGVIWVDRLGVSIDSEAVAQTCLNRTAWRNWSPRAIRPWVTHKGDVGSVWVLAGSPRMQGAAGLAARAALAAGAGRVYLAGADSTNPLWPELMTPPLGAARQALTSATAVVGCGGGDMDAAQLLDWLAAAEQLVLDADGLNAVARYPHLAQALRARATRKLRTVITPHPLEAARLLGLDGATDVQSHRLGCAQQLASQLDCTVVLKGSGTVVASPGDRPLINLSGHAALGTAGTGDVLAGWLGGLMAQAPQAPLHELAGLACSWHGEAADHVPQGSGPMLASRLVEAMAELHASNC